VVEAPHHGLLVVEHLQRGPWGLLPLRKVPRPAAQQGEEWFWFTRGHSLEGSQCAEEALRAGGVEAERPAVTSGADARLLAGGLHTLGSMLFLRGDWARAAALSQESVRLFRTVADARGTARALSRQGVAERFQGREALGAARCEEAIRIARGCGDQGLLVEMLIRAYATTGGRFAGEAPRAQLDEAAEIARRLGDLWGVAHALNRLGDLLRELGQTGEARARYEESLALFRRLDNRWMTAWSLEELGTTSSLEGDHRAAREHLAAAIRLFHDLGDRGDTVFMLRRLGMVARADGDHARGAALPGAYRGLEAAREAAVAVSTASAAETPAREAVPADVEAACAACAARRPGDAAAGGGAVRPGRRLSAVAGGRGRRRFAGPPPIDGLAGLPRIGGSLRARSLNHRVDGTAERARHNVLLVLEGLADHGVPLRVLHDLFLVGRIRNQRVIWNQRQDPA
jgi:tetratricopeptide (TPR) repeat protein